MGCEHALARQTKVRAWLPIAANSKASSWTRKKYGTQRFVSCIKCNMNEAGQPALPSTELPILPAKERVPFAHESVVLPKQDYIELKWQAHYWKEQHTRAVAREAQLNKELEQYKARVRDLEQRLYGKKSEKSAATKTERQGQRAGTRKRGQQPGAPGHGRTERSQLPVVEEIHDLDEHDKHCSSCGQAFVPFAKSEDSQIVEVEVRAHVRKIIRRQYLKRCECQGTPGLISAAPAPRLIPKSDVGVSVWTEVLLDKYLHSCPTHRWCQDWGYRGLPIAQGTLTGGLHQLSALFEPVVAAMLEQQMSECVFHGDETGWKVFEQIEGKIGYRWYLWLMHSASVVYYRMAPGRGAEVPKGHFAGLDPELTQVILVCDRYVAYKCLAKDNVVVLAFCWAHVRRDFLDAARAWPQLQAWMFSWVEDIGELYLLNERRVQWWDDTASLTEQSAEFMHHHEALRAKLAHMQQRRDSDLQGPLHSVQKKVLESLKNHWQGLTVFVEHPGVKMDNNTAERAVRNPVTGRKNYYGSGSVWSAHFAAMMFTVLQTVILWRLNPHHWLYAFLQACANNGGATPSDLSPFLPWAMADARRAELSQPRVVIASGSLEPPAVLDSS